MSLDRKYLLFALVYAAVGMALGIAMAASRNHVQFVTHAHVLLVGFVLSLLYAIIHKLWLPMGTRTLGTVQFIAHQTGALTLTVGLWLLYGNIVPASNLDPVLAVASIVVLTGVLLMLVLVVKAGDGHATSSQGRSTA